MQRIINQEINLNDSDSEEKVIAQVELTKKTKFEFMDEA